MRKYQNGAGAGKGRAAGVGGQGAKGKGRARREWIWSILVALALALMIRWPLIEPFKIPSGSMEPTLHGDPWMFRGDRIFVNKFVYGVRFPLNGVRFPFTDDAFWYAKRRLWNGWKPERWDIVVFKAAEEGALHNTLVKRIVGLPGERIHIAGGKIYVNGKPLDLPENMPNVYYEAPPNSYSQVRYGVRLEDEYSLVPEGHYLVLGDNSTSSRDGRYFGWLPGHHILGRVSSVWWPPSHWRDFTGFTHTLWWNACLILLATAVAARLFLCRSWRVEHPGLGSMPRTGAHVIVNVIAFGLPVPFTRWRLFPGRNPRRWEIVLYRPPVNSEAAGEWLMARVAGLPGEKVSLENGRLNINGKPAKLLPDDSGTRFSHRAPGERYGYLTGREFSRVPNGHFFLLLDDSTAAPDSRSLGWIPKRHLIGVAGPVWWPARARAPHSREVEPTSK